MRTMILLGLLVSWTWSADPAKPPLKALPPVVGAEVLGPFTPVVKVKGPDESNLPIEVRPNRFLPFKPKDGTPSYVAPSDAFRIYKLEKGERFTGVKWDAPLDVKEPEPHQWKDDPLVYILLARDKPGTYAIQLLSNGPVEQGPIENGLPFLVRIPGEDKKTDVTPVKPDTAPKNSYHKATPPLAPLGYGVMVIYDPLDKNMTPAQRNVIFGRQVRDWLEANCTKVDGKALYRVWPTGEDYSAAPKIWADGMALPRENVPWLIVSHPTKGGYNGPLKDDGFDIMKQYGGN